MDIFKWADDMHWLADYMDHNTGYIYAITEAENKDRIPVYDNGILIGYVNRGR